MHSRVCADNVKMTLAVGPVPPWITSPAIECLRGDQKWDELVIYIGKCGYRSPLGTEFALNTYILVRRKYDESVGNVVNPVHAK